MNNGTGTTGTILRMEWELENLDQECLELDIEVHLSVQVLLVGCSHLYMIANEKPVSDLLFHLLLVHKECLHRLYSTICIFLYVDK